MSTYYRCYFEVLIVAYLFKYGEVLDKVRIDKIISPFDLEDAARSVNSKPGLYISVNLQSVTDPALMGLLSFDNVTGYVDGVGAQFYLRKYGVNFNKIPGCELWLSLLEQRSNKNCSIAVIGASSNVNDKTVRLLREQFPMHSVDYYIDGYSFVEDELVDEIASHNFDYIFISLGQPKQEFLGMKFAKVNPNAIILGLGGSFDVYCGSVKRAPKFMIYMNLEWLYRIASQPKRIPKLIRAFLKAV
ncbi:WecB/TagA/CpsF family glycosyltransferase [Shewanella sp. SW36]|uniref:WecB/TagA/CpsF family glycosyltransferase n=1 Tax=Shewanella TaxID=22 RepID=UPI0021D92AE4|nr:MULTISPECIES: WecB/TagA/CpsF family glycosyltransferase [unclassified Shewanella]MCU7975885.1 WecB/TagA/CpsF family glycosyltransferase [Shewanella sp. SW36]MCU7991275.1 WecB/TagA/CpsF family glycosyltransferase [Shewanella sp. SW1]MCU8011267.1 WecB/TagA/CpsF family glycosyltransferase [Shewanella sp. SM74]MCU8017977.1 WecB/TagA/CpsF family glycosyltransferase [Shewanella sp. SM72]MCU8052512.1 WecB/TagA/CpsF family glycosyltransferase [Shewanella sp. SM43]